MSTIHELFPKPVYLVDNVLVNELPFYKLWCSEKVKELGASENGLLNVPSTHQTFDRFYEFPEMGNVVATICQHAVSFAEHLGYTTEDMQDVTIKNMWVNHSARGSYIFPHVHRDSLISGAFYIDCTPNDEIIFFNNPLEVMDKKPTRMTDLNIDYKKFNCVPGRLLLFKSNLLHGTQSQQSENKITISFNIG